MGGFIFYIFVYVKNKRYGSFDLDIVLNVRNVKKHLSVVSCTIIN